MASRARKVIFARVNRRLVESQETLTSRSFRDDMIALAQSQQTRYVERGKRGLDRIWFAGDMTVEPDGNFLTGTLGYTSPEQHGSFDETNWSWIKAQMQLVISRGVETARADTIAPFAIDLRDQNRWVAFAPTVRLRTRMFVDGLEHVLNNAISAAGLMPAEWEIDLVVSRDRVDEWLQVNPHVYRLKRIVKFTNPGLNLDAERQEMRALGAISKAEEFASSSSGVIDIDSDDFRRKLDGIDTGDIELRLQARGRDTAEHVVFNSNSHPDAVPVSNFGQNLMDGISVVLGVLQQYVTDRVQG